MANISAADSNMKASSPLDGYAQSFSGAQVSEPSGVGIFSLAVPLGGMDALNGKLDSLWGLSFPQTGRCIRASDKKLAEVTATLALLGLQQDQCFLISQTDDISSCEYFEHLREALGNVAYLTNQSDSWAVLDVDGPSTLRALERICPLDVSSFDTDSVGRTAMEHLSVIIERPDIERVRLFSPSSSAMSFLDAVTTSLNNVPEAASDT